MLGPWSAEDVLLSASSAPSLISDIYSALSVKDRPMGGMTALGMPPPSFDQRQLIVLMERWRRWQRPFERGRARAPGIVRRLFLAHEGVGHAEEEHQRAQPRKVGPERRDQVPARESIGIIGNAPRHAGEPQEMLREEDDVDPNESEPEMQLAD